MDPAEAERVSNRQVEVIKQFERVMPHIGTLVRYVSNLQDYPRSA
jgi:hypothetical protein